MANGNNAVKRRLSAVERAIVEDRKSRQEFVAWQRKTDRRLAKIVLMIQENQRAIARQGERLEQQGERLERQGERLEQQGEQLKQQGEAIADMQRILRRLLER